MGNLYNRIESLCKEKEVNITRMCRESGASRASLSDLKAGRKQTLSAETLKKIADYFKVTTDYLLEKSSFRSPKEVVDNWGDWGDWGPYFDANFDFGDLIRQEREAQGITVEEMGEAVGLTPEDVSNCEDGMLPINRELADKMAEFLGTDVPQMLFDNGLYSDVVPEEFHDRVAEWEKLCKAAEREASEDSVINTMPLTPTERKLKLLARHLEKIPEDTRNRLIKNFEDTVDTYLDAIGIPKEDEV